MIKRFSASSIRNGQRTTKLWDQVSFLGDFESIATTTVGAGGQSTITFSSIPQTYTHLQIRGITLTSSNYGSDVKMNFNSDTGNNYSTHGLYGQGNDAVALSYSALSAGYVVVGLQGQTNAPSPFVTDILDYTNTNKFKTTRSLASTENNSTGIMFYHSGNWRNTAAITSITLAPYVTTNFNQYTSVALYGIKA
jgi:hypothetical protein